MAFKHFIPKIEWLKGTVTGTRAIGNPTITAIASTTAIAVGMFFEGTGIPTGAKVLSKTLTSVTLDKNATSNGTSTFSFGNRIQFDYPPKKDPIGETLKWSGSAVVSKNGSLQTIEDFIEIETKITFSHISQTIKDQFQVFLLTHCLAGNSFSFFQDYQEPTSELIVTKNDNYVDPGFKIITRKGAGFSFLWEFTLGLRRVY